MADGEAAAFLVEFDRETNEATFEAYTILPDLESSSIAKAYVLATDEHAIPIQQKDILFEAIPSDSFLFSQVPQTKNMRKLLVLVLVKENHTHLKALYL